jgi:probable rRNA maturation factor
MIEFFFEEIEPFSINEKLITVWLSNVCDSEEKELSELNVIFCSDEYLLKKNIEFLNHDYYTDIITFDYCVDHLVLGDLFISIERVKDNALLNKVSFKNELHRVLVHGVLHLCGYEDKSTDDEIMMRFKEGHYLKDIVSRET